MKKWYDEEYKFSVEVTGFYMVTILRDIAGMVRKSEINMNVLTDVRLIRMVMVFVPKQ